MKTLNKDLIFKKISLNKDKIHEYGVSRVGLFGSFIRGEEKDSSDIDLLVEFYKDKKTFRNFIGFTEYMENVFGRRVEVLTPESVNPYIAPYIEEEIEYVQI